MTGFRSGRNVLAVLVLVLAHCAASAFAQGKAKVAKEFIADGAPVGGAKLSANCQAGVEAKGQAGRWVKTPLKAGAGRSRFRVALAEPFNAEDCMSLKIEAFLESEAPVTFNIRIDNASSTDEDSQTRFDLYGHSRNKELIFKPGPNELRIAVERMVNGVINNAAIDVRSLTAVQLFTRVEADAALYIKRVWIERVPRAKSSVVLVDFLGDESLKRWTAKPAELQVGKVEGDKGRRFVVKAHPKDKPGFRLGAIKPSEVVVKDWQPYDQLVVSCFNPLDRDISAGVTVQDKMGKEVIFCYKMKPGADEVELPLSAADIINLEKMVTMSIWFQALEADDYPVYVKKVYLKYNPGPRVVLTDSPDDKLAEGDWQIDLSQFYNPRGDRQKADISIPRAGGGDPLVVKCRPRTTKSRKYVLPAELAKDMAKGPCRAVGFYINHGQMLIYHAEAEAAPQGKNVVLKPVNGRGP